MSLRGGIKLRLHDVQKGLGKKVTKVRNGFSVRIARFFMLQYTKTGENITHDHEKW
jgi:hypothetical protein